MAIIHRNDLIEHNFNLFKRKIDNIYHDCVAFGQKFIKYIDFEKDFLAPKMLSISINYLHSKRHKRVSFNPHTLWSQRYILFENIFDLIIFSDLKQVLLTSCERVH